MRQFDFYEFAGVLAPGTMLLVIAALIWPDALVGIGTLNVSFGGFGLAMMVAYVLGHLLQAFGNILEATWWKFHGGWPSDWPRTRRGGLLRRDGLLAQVQIANLQERLSSDLGFPHLTFDSSLSAAEWQPLFRQVYARVCAAGRDGRAHTFNGNYGMFRGLAAVAVVGAAAVLLARGLSAWPIVLGLSGAGALAVARMHRFAKHYARETYVQFLALPLEERIKK